MRDVRCIGRGQELRSTVIHRIRFAERVSLKRGRTHGVATCTSAAALVKLPIVMGDFAGLGRKQKRDGSRGWKGGLLGWEYDEPETTACLAHAMRWVCGGLNGRRCSFVEW